MEGKETSESVLGKGKEGKETPTGHGLCRWEIELGILVPRNLLSITPFFNYFSNWIVNYFSNWISIGLKFRYY